MKDRVVLVVRCGGPFRHQLLVFGDKNVLLFLVQERQLFHGKFYDMFLGRNEEVREPVLVCFALLQRNT